MTLSSKISSDNFYEKLEEEFEHSHNIFLKDFFNFFVVGVAMYHLLIFYLFCAIKWSTGSI